jgi:hypothetical protein
MSTVRFFLVGSAFLFAACGGPSSGGETASTSGGEGCRCEHPHEGCEHCEHHGEHGEHHGDHDEHHAAMPPEVNALHDDLAPVWHQEPGAGRNAAACEHAASFRTHATTIQGMAAPGGADAERWSGAVSTLSTTVDALVTECGAGSANVESAFDAFHTAFHAVMDASHG